MDDVRFDLGKALMDYYEIKMEGEDFQNGNKKEGGTDFPVEIFTGWLGEFATAMSRATEPPPMFYYFAALTCLGSAFSGKITLASAISPQPRLFTVLLGSSGDTRKSTAIRLTTEFFKEALGEFSTCHGVGSAEGLCERFNKDDRILLVYDELRTFVSKARIETSVLLQAVTSLFELNCYESVTKTHHVNISNAHLGLLSASTPETYSSMFSSQFLDIGFINRLFVVRGESKRAHSVPPKVHLDEKDRLKRHLKEIIALVNDASESGITEMELTPEAKARWDKYYFKEMPEGESARRLDTYGLRFMPLLAINDGKTTIDLETVEKIVALLRWEYNTRLLVDPISADNRIAEMEEKIRRTMRGSGKPLDPRELKRRVNYQRAGIYIFNAAVNNLCRSKEMRYNPQTRCYEAIDA